MRSFLLIYIVLLISSNSYALHHAEGKDVYTITDAYITPPIAGNQVTAAYLTLNNNSSQPIAITGATSPMADRLELHQHTMSGGLMRMRRLSSVTVKAGESITFKPGEYHIMWFGTSKLFEKKSVLLVLNLSNGQAIKVYAEVGGFHQINHQH